MKRKYAKNWGPDLLQYKPQMELEEIIKITLNIISLFPRIQTQINNIKPYINS
jgi:hypothetical protein